MRQLMKRSFALLAVFALIESPTEVGAQSATLKREISVSRVIPGSIAVSADGRYMAISGTTGDFGTNPTGAPFNLQMSNPSHVVLLLETGDYKVRRQLLKGPEKGLPFAGSGEALSFSSDSRNLLALYDGSIHVWEAEKGKKVATWGKGLADVAFSADVRWALAKRSSGGYEAFDLSAGRSLAPFNAPAAADGGEMLVTDSEGFHLALLKDGNLVLRELRNADDRRLGPLEGKSITAVSVSKDGRTLAVASDTGKVALWNLAAKEEIAQQPGSGKAVYKMALTADGSRLVYVKDGKVHLLPGGGVLETKHAFGVGGVAFGTDATTLFTLGSMVDPIIRMWTLSNAAAPVVPR